MNNIIGTILVKVTIVMLDRSRAKHTGRYHSVKEAMDLASHAFPEATCISCIKLGVV